MRSRKAMLSAVIPRGLAALRLRKGAAPSVLLTFDDGPDESVTPAVLDRLEAHGARAVFFVIGKCAERSPALVREIAARGHLLGNHSYSHSDSYFAPHPPAPLGPFRDDILRCQKLLDPVVGSGPRLFRPPGGRLTFASIKSARDLGLACVLWSREVADWSFRTPGEGQAGGEALLGDIQPRDIVLLHDNNVAVLRLLDVLLPGLRSRSLDLSSGSRYL